jgi:hypothetical protein
MWHPNIISNLLLIELWLFVILTCCLSSMLPTLSSFNHRCALTILFIIDYKKLLWIRILRLYYNFAQYVQISYWIRCSIVTPNSRSYLCLQIRTCIYHLLSVISVMSLPLAIITEIRQSRMIVMPVATLGPWFCDTSCFSFTEVCETGVSYDWVECIFFHKDFKNGVCT